MIRCANSYRPLIFGSRRSFSISLVSCFFFSHLCSTENRFWLFGEEFELSSEFKEIKLESMKLTVRKNCSYEKKSIRETTALDESSFC